MTKIFDNPTGSAPTVTAPEKSVSAQSVQVKCVEITPAKAEKWLSQFHFKGQRSLRPSHVRYLADQMQSGNFKFTSLRLTGVLTGKTDENDNPETRWFLTDGQHCLHAVVQTGIPRVFGVQFVQVSTMDEVRKDYAEQDNGQVRTFRDSMGGLEVGQNFDLTASQLSKLGAAVRVLEADFSTRPVQLLHLKSRVELGNRINAWAGSARDFFEIVTATPNAVLLQSAPTMAVALATLEYQQEKARSFWCGIANDDGLRAGDPRRTLLYFLRQTPARERAALLFGCAQTWAAWCEERELAKIEFVREGVFSLVGTQWEAL